MVAKLQLRGLGGKIAVDRISNADKIPMERKQIRHRALRSCMSQKLSLELVHGLLVHISCSVSVDPTFVLQQGGKTRHAGTVCDEGGCIHCAAAKVDVTVLLWPRMRLWLWKLPQEVTVL